MTERRYDPTVGRWRLVATAGASVAPARPASPAGCPYCPASGASQLPLPAYQLVVLEDRAAGLAAEPPPPAVPGTPLFLVEPAFGAAELLLYSDNHDRRLADLDVERLARVVDVWAHRYSELGAREDIQYVFIAASTVPMPGAEPSHPHIEIHGYPDIPPRPRAELDAATAHREQHGTCVFCEVPAHERADGSRVIAENGSFLATVPFAARMPYEVHLTMRRHAPSLLDLTDPERHALADILSQVLRGLDRFFAPSPAEYWMAVHQAPTVDGPWLPVSHLHLELVPHRGGVAAMRRTGAALGSGLYVNDVPPEAAAASLRAAISQG
jgi:UDPglucose--hexose-1-phosphate uridylyltransferase